jgi:replication factor A2
MVLGLPAPENIKSSSSSITFSIDDGTGSIKIMKYNEEDMSEKQSFLRDYIYIRVYGQLRDQKIIAHSLQPVTDFNEITFHYLDALSVHLRATAGVKSMFGGASNFKQLSQGSNSSGVLLDAFGGVQGASKGNSASEQILATFERIAKMTNDDRGVSISTVIEQLPQFKPDEIRRIVTELSDDGQLYSTIDEEHYKSTNE